MSKPPRSFSAGFTLVELMVALGISAGIGLSAFSMIEHFNRSKATSEVKADQSDLRNLIFSALKNPATCPQNIVAVLPSTTFAPLTGVHVKIRNSAGNADLVQDATCYGNACYAVTVSGVVSSTTAAGTYYHAQISLTDDRTQIGLGKGPTGNKSRAQIGSTTVTQLIPLTILVNGAGAIASCSATMADVDLAGGVHDISQCNTAGGTPVEVVGVGRVCDFSEYNFTVNATAIQSACTAYTGCNYHSPGQCDCTATTATYTFPACPSPPVGTGAVYGTAPNRTYDCSYATAPTCTSGWFSPTSYPGPGNFCELTDNEQSCVSAPNNGVFSPGPPATCTTPAGCPGGLTLAGADGSGGYYCNLPGAAAPSAAPVPCPGALGWTEVVTYLTNHAGGIYTCE